MDTNVSDNITLSKEVLAAAFNIADMEPFYKVEGEEKVLIDQKKIDELLLKKLGDKTEGLIAKEVSIVEKAAEGKAKRLIYSEVEKGIKEELGVEFRVSDGFLGLKEKVIGDGKKTVDVEKTEKFINTVRDYEKKLKDQAEESANKLLELQRTGEQSDAKSYLVDLFSRDESRLSIKDANILENHANLIIKDLESEGKFIKVKDGKRVLVDSEGSVLNDKDNGFQPFDVDKITLSSVKSKYNPESVGKDISSPNPGGTDVITEVKTANGVVKIPDFKNAAEAVEFMDKAEREGQFGVVKAVGEKLTTLN